MGTFPQTATLGQPFVVPTRSTGPASQVTVWLEDGTTASLTGAPVGAVNAASVVLVPKQRGTWRLLASVTDACGRERDRTATARIVTVH